MVKIVELKKYMEFIIDESVVKDKIKFGGISFEYTMGIDFAREANIFYGYNNELKLWEHANDFNDYIVVCRLTNWNKQDNKESYYLRVLKSNKDEKVDFKEESDYLKSFIEVKLL